MGLVNATLHWPSITTPYRWSGMTNHEKIRKHLHRPSMSLGMC